MANIITVKQNVVKMLMDERKRNTVNQQSYLLPKFIDNPELHVGKSFKHKCKEEGSNEVIWCSGKVLSIHALKDKTAEFCVRYEVDDNDTEWYFPLLIDMLNGDLIIDNLNRVPITKDNLLSYLKKCHIVCLLQVYSHLNKTFR